MNKNSMTIVGYKGVTLNPPATSFEEATARTKDNPLAQEFDKKWNAAMVKALRDGCSFFKIIAP